MNQSVSVKYVFGVDEVGRGPMAGPVSVAVCSIPKQYEALVRKALQGITDSKQLSEKQREDYFIKIQALEKTGALDYVISHVSAGVIDRKGIQYALRTALIRSLYKMNLPVEQVFVYLDGSLYAPKQYDQETVIKGDQKIFHIAVASVIAKVLRDRKMVKYGKRYPKYGFEQHKGYGTKHHRNMIKKWGITPLHRKTWIKT